MIIRNLIHQKKFLRYYCISKLNGVKLKKEKKDGYDTQQFLDTKIVKVYGGKGGDGAIAMLRELSNEFGGPCGGNGGNGGHVIFRGSSQTADLSGLETLLRAEEGVRGGGKCQDGATGEHNIVQVPVGTYVKSYENKEVVADINMDELEFIAARGGAGGKGNRFFYSAEHVAPTIAERGAFGDEAKLILEVKLLADFGLVGVPNAGKSTLLRALTRARPKVASYAFTTLRPYVGSIDFVDPGKPRITICDIPGIVEDAHNNYGLGLEFLRHIERCRGLLFLVDLSDDPIEQYSVLLNELNLYRPLLTRLPRLVVCNKLDKPNTRASFERFRRYLVQLGDELATEVDNNTASSRTVLLAISALNSVNLDRLVTALQKVHMYSLMTTS